MRNSVTHGGIGACCNANSFSFVGWIPSASNRCPRYTHDFCMNVHFSSLSLRGHVNKKNSKNPKRLWKGVGGSSVQLDIKKNWKTYFYALFPLVLASIRTSITL